MSVTQIELTLPDGSRQLHSAGITGREIAQKIGERLAKAAIAVKLDQEILDLNRPLVRCGSLQILTAVRDGKADPDALYCIRHSCAHVMAEAILKLWPQARLVYGPPVEDGFYYDIDFGNEKISSEDFPRIEKEMRRIVQEKKPFTRLELSREAGLEKIRSEGNPYKLENATRAEGALSFYITGTEPGKDFEDLCRGPHVPDTSYIKGFKVMSLAGAYLHGDANKAQLTRVYGTAFSSQKELDDHLHRIEEAKKRDHRVLGKKHQLFTLSPRVGQGLALWMPNGGIVRTQLGNFMQDELFKRGYSPVYTPHIGSIELYKISGHFPYYKDSQYPTIKCCDHEHNTDSSEEYLLKPMNCPHHCQIYAAELRSYRDLPIRLAEFGTVYRYEKSGQLNGLTRVRGLTQDDAHLFCTEDQVEAEIRDIIGLTQYVLQTLGLSEYRVQVSLRDPDSSKYTGDPAVWDRAEETLKRIAREMNLPHEAVPGEAAFYGPKIDFMVKDCIGREWQLGTVQLDYNLPERFQLEYVGSDNKRHRPVMIHRAPFGSFERFVGILIEHFAAAFPMWLAPTQVYIANITDEQKSAVAIAAAKCRAVGLRVEENTGSVKINAKASIFEERLIPAMLVIGEREAQNGTVSVRGRGRKNLGVMTVDAFVEQAARIVAARQLEFLPVANA